MTSLGCLSVLKEGILLWWTSCTFSNFYPVVAHLFFPRWASRNCRCLPGSLEWEEDTLDPGNPGIYVHNFWRIWLLTSDCWARMCRSYIRKGCRVEGVSACAPFGVLFMYLTHDTNPSVPVFYCLWCLCLRRIFAVQCRNTSEQVVIELFR